MAKDESMCGNGKGKLNCGDTIEWVNGFSFPQGVLHSRKHNMDYTYRWPRMKISVGM